MAPPCHRVVSRHPKELAGLSSLVSVKVGSYAGKIHGLGI